MDVWFDTGTTHTAVLATRPESSFPADLYLEGSDTYRGWFNSSLITSVADTGIAPYRGILTTGYSLDGQGRKMRQSLGHTIVPYTIEKQFGAENFRLWVDTVDTTSDVRVTVDNFALTTEAVRKIRHTLRYLVAHTGDFDPEKDAVAVELSGTVDRYLLVRLKLDFAQVQEAYDAVDFESVEKTNCSFLVHDLSAFYLDVAQDVVYIEADNEL